MWCEHAQQRGTESNTGHVLQSTGIGRGAGYDSQSCQGRFDRIVMVVSAHGHSGITGDSDGGISQPLVSVRVHTCPSMIIRGLLNSAQCVHILSREIHPMFRADRSVRWMPCATLVPVGYNSILHHNNLTRTSSTVFKVTELVNGGAYCRW
eukprot:m.20645 g.20645  ORF g.20645 m.20645 type:complete len:151 (+) comp10260_c0_seq1:447-899(+)